GRDRLSQVLIASADAKPEPDTDLTILGRRISVDRQFEGGAALERTGGDPVRAAREEEFAPLRLIETGSGGGSARTGLIGTGDDNAGRPREGEDRRAVSTITRGDRESIGHPEVQRRADACRRVLGNVGVVSMGGGKD